MFKKITQSLSWYNDRTNVWRWHKQLLLAVVMIGLSFTGYSQVSGYSFAQSSGTYTAVTGTPILVNTDFGNSAVQNIGFTFNYNSTNFTQFIVSADGSMRFGTVAPTSGTTPISTATNTNAIAALARDGLSFGGVIVSTTGTAPNRVCVIQWTQYQVHWSAATETINMQIRLNETSNVVEIVYSNAAASATNRTAQVGLKGLAGDFNNRTTTTSWVASTAGTLATSTMAYSTAVTLPTNGLTYTWTPPTCIAPSALNVTNLTTTSASANWTASSTTPSGGYDWELRTTGAAGSGATGLVSSGNVANTVLTNPFSGLTANTNYTFYIRSNCGASDLSAWASLPIFTGYCVASSTNQTSWISAFTSTGASTNINYTATAGNTGGYANLMATHRITNFIDNGPTPISLTAGGPTCGFAIWIDWNNNLIFEASERVFNTTGFVTTTNGSITIPFGTTPGDYRMRVLVDWNASNPTNPCGNITRGGFVDYTFEVSAPPACVFPTALNTSNILAQSASLNWTASTSNPANGYQWEVRTSGAGGSGATGLVTSGTVAAGVVTANATGLSPLTNYTFYVRASCAGATFSDWVSGSFATPCLPPTVATTTPGTRCGTGTVQLGATTAGTVLNWYANPTGGVSLGTGNTFTTPSIAATTSFYVSAGNISSGNNAILGAGATNSVSTAASFLPGGWGGTKTQYIIRASELIAAGVSAGPINSIGFEPTTSGQTYQGFFVRVGQTTETVSTTAFINTGLTQVFAGTGTNNGFTPVANTVNTLAFSSPLTWDGASNIVVSISWSLVPGAFTATGSTMKVDNVGFASSAYRQMDQLPPLDMQNELTATATGTSRPRFTINGNVICASPRTVVVATVTAPPAFTLTSPTATICLGQTSTPITIATGASDYNTYVWSPATGVSGDAATGWSFNPTATSTFTLTASQSGGTLCAVTTTVVVTVNPVPSPIVITSPVAVCANNIQALTIAGGTINNVSILQENFNGATNNWTTTNLSTGGTPAIVAWTLRPNGFATGGPWSSNDASQFYLSDSDSGGSGNNTDVSLISPTFSTVGFTNANISFWHRYQQWSTGTGNVQYSIDGGTNWINIQSFTASVGTANVFNNAIVTLPAGALNQSAVQIRFQHLVTWGYYWGIDNVSVSGTQTTNITWAPVTNLFTDAAATTAYTGGTATTVYTKSATAGSQTYTITATTGVGCTTTNSVIVNTSTPLLPGTISGATTLCNAGTTTTLTTNGAAGGTWSSSNTAIATVNASGVVTAVATGSVNITYTHNNPAPCTTLTSPVHTIAVQVTAAPTGTATQSFCGASNITQLVVNGTGIKWYTAATGGALIPSVSSVGLVNGTTYHASQTIANCESVTRLAVTAVINTPVSAGTNGTITLCAGTSPTNAQLFGQLGGTPTVGGTWTNVGLVYTYSVTGISPCANASATVTVNEITPANAGTNGILAVCAGVTPTSAELFASLGGTPTAGGIWSNIGLVHTYTVAGTTPCPSASANVTVSVITLTFFNTTASNSTVGSSYNLNASVTGNTQTVVYSVSPALPSGLSLDTATGIISGTPTTATASATYTVTATQGTCIKTQGYTFAVNCPTIIFTNSTAMTATVGSVYNLNASVTGNTQTVVYSVSPALPTGLSLNTATGAISGTPTTATASATYTVTATQGTCIKTQGYTFAVSCPNLTFVNNTLPNRNYNQAYSQTLSVSNTTTAVTYSLSSGSLPLGFTLSTAGVISGTSTSTGVSTFTVLAIDANGCTVSKSFSIGLNQIPITVTAIALSKVFGTSDPVLTYSVVPALQAGDSFTGALTRVAGENVGTYAISQGNLSAGSNYLITFVGANFTITKANQTINWSQNLVIGCDGETTYQLIATASSGLAVSYASQNTSIATISGSTLNIVGQGSVNITASQAGNNNYNPATNVVSSIVISQPSLIRKHWRDVIFFDNSSNSYSNFQWYKNGVAVNGATLQYFKENGNLNGVYHATAMKNGVMITSCSLVSNDTLPEFDIKLYPNPVRPGDTFETETTLPTSSLTNAKIRVYNISGAFVGQTEVLGAITTVNAPTTQGVYIVKLVLENGNVYTVNLLVK
jgi:hypothetical protein